MKREDFKYELLRDDKIWEGVWLYRIRARKNFGDVKAGDLGGYVQSEENLSQKGDCWVYDSGRVYGKARVSGNAEVWARVYGRAQVSGYARICNDARVYGKARVFGNAIICDNAQVYGCAQVYDDVRMSGYSWAYQYAKVSGTAWLDAYARIHGAAEASRDYYGGYQDIIVCDSRRVQPYGHAQVSKHAKIFGDAKVYGDARVSK